MSTAALSPKALAKAKKAKAVVLSCVLRNPAELQEKLNQAARSTILHQALTAEMNAELEAVKARFTPKLAAHIEDIDSAKASVQSYCETHREALFGGKKTLDLPGGHTLSFRDNGGAVKTIGRLSQETVLDRLIESENEEVADLFITWKASLNKNVIATKFADHKEFLTQIGLKIEDSESFTIDLGLQAGAEAKSTHAAAA